MAKPRMIQGQFGTTLYDSNDIPPNQNVATNAIVNFQESERGIVSTPRHNDDFYLFGGTDRLNRFYNYVTFDYIDLRDLMKDQECMDGVTINVQRLRENPLITAGWNLPPGQGIEETLVFVLGDLSLDTVQDLDLDEIVKAGFAPIPYSAPTTEDPATGASLPFQILYREIRRYMPDNSQTYYSPNQIGSYAGATGDAGLATTTYTGRLNLTSRTIGGYPDIIVGPGITVIRAVSVYLADRGIQAISGGGPTDVISDQFQYLTSRIGFAMPGLQWNIVGTQRAMTDTEIATYYSNILVNNNQ